MSTTTEAAPDATQDADLSPRHATLDGRSCKALALACSTEEARPLLQHARVRNDGTFEATNGHLLTRMTPEYRTEDGVIRADPPEDPVPGWLIHRHDLKRLKVAQSLRLDLETGELVILDKNGEPEIAIPDGASSEDTEGPFPDTDRVYSAHTRPECLRVRLAGRYLNSLAKLARAAEEEGVVLEIPLDVEERTTGRYEGGPTGIHYATGDTHGLLMPMILDA